MSVWKQVTQQAGKLGRHVAQQVAQEPMEILKEAVGVDEKGENQALEAVEQGQQTQQQTTDDSGHHQGFKTEEDYKKYSNLTEKRDQMDLAVTRKKLFQEFGLDTDLDSGMQKARQEFMEKEEERNKVEEQEVQEKEWMEEKKKEEDMSVVAAKGQASAENKAWGAG
ncbi:MAG: hypothetical protein ABII80_03535 [bacterium]